MTYIRLDDKITDHPKIGQVSAEACWLFVCALCYCSRHLTDGFVPKGVLGQLSNVSRPAKAIAELIAVRLVHEADGGWLVHDYAGWQRTRSQVEKIKKERAAAGSKGGSKPKANGKQTGNTELAFSQAKDPPESRVQSPESRVQSRQSSSTGTRGDPPRPDDDDDRRWLNDFAVAWADRRCPPGKPPGYRATIERNAHAELGDTALELHHANPHATADAIAEQIDTGTDPTDEWDPVAHAAEVDAEIEARRAEREQWAAEQDLAENARIRRAAGIGRHPADTPHADPDPADH